MSIKDLMSPFLWRRFYNAKVLVSQLKREKAGTLSSYGKMDADSIVIVGNGPSLNETLEKRADLFSENSVMCVNFFACSDLYTKIRPEYYVCTDIGFFSDNDDPKIVKQVNELAGSIIDSTSWPMTFFVPEYGRNSAFEMRIRKNSNIEVAYFSGVGINHEYFDTDTLIRMLQKDIIYPPTQTVLNAGLAIALYFKTKRIYVVGADTSWHEQIKVNQNNNDLMDSDDHFYADDYNLQSIIKSVKGKSFLAEELENDARALILYEFYYNYAASVGCTIYNASAYSCIDVFERF